MCAEGAQPMLALTGDQLEHVVIALSGAVGGGGLLRVGVYISHSLPPLKPDAGFWKTFAYNLIKGLSGVDPSATVLSPTAMSSLPASVSAQVTQTAAADKP